MTRNWRKQPSGCWWSFSPGFKTKTKTLAWILEIETDKEKRAHSDIRAFENLGHEPQKIFFPDLLAEIGQKVDKVFFLKNVMKPFDRWKTFFRIEEKWKIGYWREIWNLNLESPNAWQGRLFWPLNRPPELSNSKGQIEISRCSICLVEEFRTIGHWKRSWWGLPAFLHPVPLPPPNSSR